MDTNKKNKIIAICITFVTVIVLAGITYTFFSSAVSNSNNEKFSTQTATMSLVFDDDDNGINATLTPGESVVKKFSIENTGTVDAYAQINWVDLVNTYTEGSLVYDLYKYFGSYNQLSNISVNNNPVPLSETPTTSVLAESVLIPAHEKCFFELVIYFQHLENVDQTSDIDAQMHSKFNIQSAPKKTKITDKIKSIVSERPTNTLYEIDATEYEGTVNKYVFSFNRFVYPSEYELDNLENCENNIMGVYEMFGTVITPVCQINPSTGKYNVSIKGIPKNNPSPVYVFDNKNDCESIIEEYNLQNTTCVNTDIVVSNWDKCTNTFAYDGTSDNNLRYVGTNPCNHIIVAGFPGRIIGVMAGVDDGNGNLETRLKVVLSKLDNSPELISWGSTNNFNTSNVKDYIYSSVDVDCMSSVTKGAKRYLRSFNTANTSFLIKEIYDIEKISGSVFTGNPTSSVATYAPVNLSDVWYSTGALERVACMNDEAARRNCILYNNWLFDEFSQFNTVYTWTLNASVQNPNQVYTTYYFYELVNTTNTVQYKPTLYLKPDLPYLGGTGSESDPYIVDSLDCIGIE